MERPNKQIAPLKHFHEYNEMRKDLERIATMVLHSFLKHQASNGVPDRIIMGFVARTTMALRAMFTLWEIKDEHDGWSIYRSIVDRFLLLSSLGQNNQFELFDDWTFYNDVKRLNQTRGDLEFKSQLAGKVQKLTEMQSERFRKLEKNRPVWRRPNAEEIAKALDLKFIYDYGYNYASGFVHPVSTEGQRDIPTLTGVTADHLIPTDTGLLHNSLLVSTLLIQEGLNLSSLKWAAALYNCLDGLRMSLEREVLTCQTDLLMASKLFIDSSLCAK